MVLLAASNCARSHEYHRATDLAKWKMYVQMLCTPDLGLMSNLKPLCTTRVSSVARVTMLIPDYTELASSVAACLLRNRHDLVVLT